MTLINGKKASINFNNPQWVGFDSIVEAEVIFGALTFIENIDVGYLSDPKSWIFPPAKIELILYKSEKEFEKRIFKGDSIKGMEDGAMKNLQLAIDKEVQSIRLRFTNLQTIPDWHEGKGNKAWLFMDEWIFN